MSVASDLIGWMFFAHFISEICLEAPAKNSISCQLPCPGRPPLLAFPGAMRSAKIIFFDFHILTLAYLLSMDYNGVVVKYTMEVYVHVF